MIEDYVEMIQNTSYDRSGANSLCYLFDDKVLLYEAICVDDIDELIKIINQYYHDGINIPRIIDYKFDSSKEAEKYDKRYHYGWVLEERAKGEELKRNTDFTIRLTDIEDFDNEYVRYTEECNEYLKYVQKMSEIDMSQLDKFVADFMRIQEEDLIVIDPSKPSNFFYDSEIGFSFIDLNLSNGHNPYNSKEYTAQYVIVNLYPFVPRLEFVEKGVDLKGRLILDSIYFKLINTRPTRHITIPTTLFHVKAS